MSMIQSYSDFINNVISFDDFDRIFKRKIVAKSKEELKEDIKWKPSVPGFEFRYFNENIVGNSSLINKIFSKVHNNEYSEAIKLPEYIEPKEIKKLIDDLTWNSFDTIQEFYLEMPFEFGKRYLRYIENYVNDNLCHIYYYLKIIDIKFPGYIKNNFPDLYFDNTARPQFSAFKHEKHKLTNKLKELEKINKFTGEEDKAILEKLVVELSLVDEIPFETKINSSSIQVYMAVDRDVEEFIMPTCNLDDDDDMVIVRSIDDEGEDTKLIMSEMIIPHILKFLDSDIILGKLDEELFIWVKEVLLPSIYIEYNMEDVEKASQFFSKKNIDDFLNDLPTIRQLILKKLGSYPINIIKLVLTLTNDKNIL